MAQSRRAFCGVASSAIVINAALQRRPPLTQETLFTPTASSVRSELAVSFSGLTLDQLADIIRAHGLHVQVVHAAQSSLEAFRNTARAMLAEPLTFLIVNYDRATLEQDGAGHISPVGAYSPETDRMLVLDVAAYKYPYTWVPASKLKTGSRRGAPDFRSRSVIMRRPDQQLRQRVEYECPRGEASPRVQPYPRVPAFFLATARGSGPVTWSS